MMRTAPILAVALALAGCQQAPEPAAPQSPAETGGPTPSGAPLDEGALRERTNPDRLLAYFADAIGRGDWDAAALAWAKDGMTGEQLEALVGLGPSPIIAFGKGVQEGAAGSIYYQAPAKLIADGGKRDRTGSITLRRVNDVPGAEDWQLAWHIEKLEWND